MRYHLTNHQFSTVALIDDTAELLERVVYTAYGEGKPRTTSNRIAFNATDFVD